MQPPDDPRAEDPFSGSRAAVPVIQPVSPQLLEQQRVSPATSPVPSATPAGPGIQPQMQLQSPGNPGILPNPAVRGEAGWTYSPEQLAQLTQIAQYQHPNPSGLGVLKSTVCTWEGVSEWEYALRWRECVCGKVCRCGSMPFAGG